MLHIVRILEPYLTCGTWHNWVTQNCTQGFVGPCRCPSQRKEGSKNTDRAIHDIRDERMIAVQKVATSTKPKMQ